jgi:hypothetical protein
MRRRNIRHLVVVDDARSSASSRNVISADAPADVCAEGALSRI